LKAFSILLSIFIHVIRYTRLLKRNADDILTVMA